MPTFLAHVEIAKLHESLLAVEKELAECKKIARMYQAKDHAPERESSVHEKTLAVVEEAGSIIRNDIQLHPAWDNCRRGRDHLKDFDEEIPDPIEYVNDTFPRTLAVLLTTVCGCQDVLAASGAGVEQGECESMVAGGRGVSAVAGGGGELVSAGGGGEPTSGQPGGGARRKLNKDESRDAVFMYMVGTMVGKAVIGQTFKAPHDLKLSQAFKMRGMSQKNMAFLSSRLFVFAGETEIGTSGKSASAKSLTKPS